MIRAEELMASTAEKILVVDDDTDIRETLAQILEFEGFDVTCASNGQEAMDRLESLKPNLILLDLMMPIMNGYEFRRAQKAKPEIAEIPVIILSADGNVQQKAAAADVQAFLKKPIELEVLLSAIRQHCTPIQAHPA
jgi:two-component system chemotaxis response regulator CheY